MADETSDIGHESKLSIVIRYFDSCKNRLSKTFIGIQRVTSVIAEAIFNSINDLISSYNIKWENVFAVCFDTTSTMSGNKTEVQARCK